MLLYGDKQLAASGKGVGDGVPPISMKRAAKRHFVVQGAPEHRTSRWCSGARLGTLRGLRGW